VRRRWYRMVRKGVKITKSKRIDGRTYVLLTKGFDTRREARAFIKALRIKTHLYYRIIQGDDGKWYVYGAPRMKE